MSSRLTEELEQLPVKAIVGPLNEALRPGSAAIVKAAPGAGKSTVLPLTVLETLPDDRSRIIVLEPRRVAARQIASRMAWLLGEPVGRTVGYRIRLENRISAQTRIEVVTEGVLTRMLLDDPALEGVAVVMFDEFHERSLHSDEAFALTRQCREILRPDLRLVVMSATVDSGELAAVLQCPVLESGGKMYPVEIIRSDEEADSMNVSELVARTVLQAHRTHEGDILAFLPGEGEIRRTAEMLRGCIGSTEVCPLYGLLSNEEQSRAIAPSRPGARKVVLATSIAETSLTIEGVRVVIDSGLHRKAVYDARTGLSGLETERISLDMAMQRMGRAGRVAPGVCYRLWSGATESRMATLRTPEILVADLSRLVLDAALWGEHDVWNLPWLTPPPKPAVTHARQLLTSLGALGETGELTPWGRRIARMPCHPRIAQMLLKAGSPEQRSLAADIAALLECKDPMAGDTDTSVARRLDALRQARRSGKPGRWGQILKIAHQYSDMVQSGSDNASVNPYDVGILLAAAYPERIARLRDGGSATFQLPDGSRAGMEISDELSGTEWIVAASLHRKPNAVGRILLASVVDPSDLQPFTAERDNISWDSKTGSIVARRETRIGSILVNSRPLHRDVHEDVLRLVCEAITREGRSLLDFNESVRQLQRRISFTAARHPELELPAVDTAAVCTAAPEWGPLFIGKATTAAELRKTDLTAVIRSLLTWPQQQALDQMAPTHVTVPTGSRIRLEYRTGAEAPVLRVRLQECFGLTDTPLIDGSPVLMELLSPGFKPVQLTSDLRSFWQTAYFEVRKELRRRYPKHAWPDNPLEADPVKYRRK